MAAAANPSTHTLAPLAGYANVTFKCWPRASGAEHLLACPCSCLTTHGNPPPRSSSSPAHSTRSCTVHGQGYRAPNWWAVINFTCCLATRHHHCQSPVPSVIPSCLRLVLARALHLSTICLLNGCGGCDAVCTQLNSCPRSTWWGPAEALVTGYWSLACGVGTGPGNMCGKCGVCGMCRMPALHLQLAQGQKGWTVAIDTSTNWTYQSIMPIDQLQVVMLNNWLEGMTKIGYKLGTDIGSKLVKAL